MPKQHFNKELEKAVREYHEWHGDSNVKLVGFVTSPEGDTLLLTRITDEQKRTASVLLSYEYDMFYQRWDIKEVYSSSRNDEAQLLQAYMQYGDETDDGSSDQDDTLLGLC